MNQYEKLLKRKAQEQNKYPFIFSTLDEMKKELAKRNININEVEYDVSKNNLYFIRKHADKFDEITEKYEKKIKKRIEVDLTGEGFIKDMFKTQLRNYEYGYTLVVNYAIEMLGFTPEEIDNDVRLKNALKLAKKELLKEESEM